MNLISRKEAINKGLTRYFTGYKCVHGHISERRVQNHECCECRKVRKRKPEHLKIKKAKKTPEKIKPVKIPKAHPNAHKARTTASKRIKKVLTGQLKNESGATPNQFETHIGNKFQAGMNWDNYGSVWHIDHIVPLSHFDLTIPDHRKMAGHYSNLQPLFISDNLAKSDKIISDTQINLIFNFH